jgi:hypothetical protein
MNSKASAEGMEWGGVRGGRFWVGSKAHRSGDRCRLSHEFKGVHGEDGAGRSARRVIGDLMQGALSVAAARRHLSRKRERGERQQGAPREAATASLGGTKAGGEAPSLSPLRVDISPASGREGKDSKAHRERPRRPHSVARRQETRRPVCRCCASTSLPPPLGGREEKGRKRTGETPVPPKGRKRTGETPVPPKGRKAHRERPRRPHSVARRQEARRPLCGRNAPPTTSLLPSRPPRGRDGKDSKAHRSGDRCHQTPGTPGSAEALSC